LRGKLFSDATESFKEIRGGAGNVEPLRKQTDNRLRVPQTSLGPITYVARQHGGSFVVTWTENGNFALEGHSQQSAETSHSVHGKGKGDDPFEDISLSTMPDTISFGVKSRLHAI
jgi:hypothetical protein